MMIRTYFQQGS